MSDCDQPLNIGDLVEVDMLLSGETLLKQVHGDNWHVAEILDIRRGVLGGSFMTSCRQSSHWQNQVNSVPHRDEILLFVFEDGTQSWFDSHNIRRFVAKPSPDVLR